MYACDDDDVDDDGCDDNDYDSDINNKNYVTRLVLVYTITCKMKIYYSKINMCV